MSSDSAIERLRALLNERGVKHVGNGGMTKWTNENGCVCRAYTRPGHLTVDVAIMDASPEQAIAATLGPGTCEMEYVSDFMSWHCKACDQMDMAPRNPKPRYCKWCGRKVVDE